MTDHKCNRCGAELKVVEVRVPIKLEHWDRDTMRATVFTHYETREDVAECPRCTGGY